MAFVKLDCGILDSTLWYQLPQREIFVTALLMAVPHEITTPAPQIDVRTISLTGFVVPPGWYGFVPAAGAGIVRRAMVEPDIGLAALEALGSPDPESRSPEFDGRRMVRIDGGYLILNYQKYRDRDYTGAERAARYRKRKAELLAASRRDISASHRDITQAEAEAEAEAEERSRSSKEKDYVPSALVEIPPSAEVSPAPRVIVPIKEIVNLYHELLPMLPRVEKITKAREGYIRQRWIEDMPDLESWGRFFRHVAESKFLTGRAQSTDGRRPFRADIEFLCKPSSFAKIAEEKYHQ